MRVVKSVVRAYGMSVIVFFKVVMFGVIANKRRKILC